MAPSRPSSRDRRTITRTAGIAALVVAAGATVALTVLPLRQPPAYTSAAPGSTATPAVSVPSTTASTSTTTGAPSATGATPSTTSTSVAPTRGPSVTGAAALPPTALVVGDGFTAPDQASGAVDQSFACQAARARGWGCINDSIAGSGYLSAGVGGTFAQQLTRAVTPTKVGLVVISGGVADRLASPSAAQSSVRTTLATARSTYPGATIVVLRPFSTLPNTTTMRTVAQTLAAAASAPPATYVDTLAWFDGVSPVTTPDGRSLTGPAVAVPSSWLYAALPDASDG